MAPPTVAGTPAGSTAATPYAYAVDAAADFLMGFLVVTGASGSPPALTATYNSVAMTTLSPFDCGGSEWMALHHLVSPATGSNDFGFTSGGGSRYGSALIALDGVNASAPITDNNEAVDFSSTTIANTVTSTTDDLCVMFAMAFTTATLTAGSGETIHVAFDNGGGNTFYIITKAGASGSTSFAPTFAGAQAHYSWALAIAGASGGGGEAFRPYYIRG